MLHRRMTFVLAVGAAALSLTGPVAAQFPAPPAAPEEAVRVERAAEATAAEARAVEAQRAAQQARAEAQTQALVGVAKAQAQSAREQAEELRAQQRAVVSYEAELQAMRAQLETARRELEAAARNVAERRLVVRADGSDPDVLVTRESNGLFAPSYIVRSDNPQSVLRTFGLASRLWSDMELVPLTEDLGRYFSTSEGLLVIRAPSDDELDLADGDVILTISGRPPSSAEHAMRILASFEPGETIELAIMRQGAPQTVAYALPPADND